MARSSVSRSAAGCRMHERARNCMHGMRSGWGQGLIAFQIVRTYLDTQSSIEHDYLPSFLLGNEVMRSGCTPAGKKKASRCTPQGKKDSI